MWQKKLKKGRDYLGSQSKGAACLCRGVRLAAVGLLNTFIAKKQKKMNVVALLLFFLTSSLALKEWALPLTTLTE